MSHSVITDSAVLKFGVCDCVWVAISVSVCRQGNYLEQVLMSGSIIPAAAFYNTSVKATFKLYNLFVLSSLN